MKNYHRKTEGAGERLELLGILGPGEQKQEPGPQQQAAEGARAGIVRI